MCKRQATSETRSLLGKPRFLQVLIDAFTDQINRGAIDLTMGVKANLSAWEAPAACGEKREWIVVTKRRCGVLHRLILTFLYTAMLVPGTRGDVLKLQE